MKEVNQKLKELQLAHESNLKQAIHNINPE